jgi:hypothetical protein
MSSMRYHGAGPNGGIIIGGVHIHHMVFGIGRRDGDEGGALARATAAVH